MALHFITGAAGAGKTTVSTELSLRGYEIHDTDDPHHTGIAGWHERSTGLYIAGFNELEMTEDNLNTYIWALTPAALANFSERAKTDTIYLSGRLREADNVLAACKNIAFLTLSGEVIRERLTKRAQIPGEVTWGREEWQIARSIEANIRVEQEYRDLGAVMIDADRPIQLVADDILAATL